MNIKELMSDCVIFALNTERSNEQEYKAVLATFEYYNLPAPILGEGCYNGEIEQCYIVPIKIISVMDCVFDLTKAYNQESVLLIVDGEGALLYHEIDKDGERIGKVHQTTAAIAQRQSAYTRVTLHGETYYYISED